MKNAGHERNTGIGIAGKDSTVPGKADSVAPAGKMRSCTVAFGRKKERWMRTLILQSYRTHDVAPWIGNCMQTVREWAAMRGHAYEFIDDRFFEYAPGWVRQRCGSMILPVTDVARLYLLRERLNEGWDRVAWIDADVLVFDPRNFVFDDTAPYSLCFELTCSIKPESGLKIGEAVNNAVMFFTPNHPLLDFWIFAAEEILRVYDPAWINAVIVGTRFLSSLGGAVPMRVLKNVGLFVPPLTRDIAAGGGTVLDRWAARLKKPIAAANFCRSMQDLEFSGVVVDATDMQRAVERLLETRGGIVNDIVSRGTAAGVLAPRPSFQQA